MCGRATLTTPIEEIAEQLGVAPIPIGPPRFNIAPSTPLLVLRPMLALVKWGLQPFWGVKDGKPKRPFIQARAETVTSAPPFREAFKARRCLIVVDGFYEWSHPEGEKKGLPHHVHRKDHRVLTLGGLWESYRGEGGDRVETCAVVTTAARGAILGLHDRMPLVIAAGDRDRWLGAPEEAKDLLAHVASSQTERAAELVIVPVSRVVNDAKNDDPRCLAPANADEPVLFK